MQITRPTTHGRTRQRYLQAARAIIALLLLAVVPVVRAAPARAATAVVTNCNASGAGSLQDALRVAAAGDTITFAQDCTDANTITLTDVLVPTQNVTIDATAPTHTITISGGNSVGLFTVNPGVTLSLRGLTLTNGAIVGGSRVFGGAIAANGGTLNVAACTFVGNTATGGEGGAIANVSGGTVNVTGSAFARNSAPGGGAIANLGTLNVVNSTFSGNTATGSGGAIYSRLGTLAVVGSTFSGNGARNGGAIFNTGTLTLALSVLAGNTAGGGSGPDLYGSVDTDGGGNVVGDTTASTGLTQSTDKLNTDPLLAPFALYSPGLVQTFAPQTGSPALDIAPCPTDPTTMIPLATDARGVPRPQGANCDAGSYELATGG